MKFKLQTITSLFLFLLAGPVLAQSITVTPSPVVAAKGDTASVTLAFVADADTTNFDFVMAYDETVVDEAAIAVDCSAASGLGLTVLSCLVNTAANEVRGIGTNIPPSVLASGDFATVDFPVLAGAVSGDSVQAFTANFSASGVGSPFATTWTLTVQKADQTITGFAANPASGVIAGSSTLTATASSGLAVTFGSATPAICTVAGDQVTYVAAGTCTVTADQAGDDSFNAAPQVTLGIGVVKADQAITGFAADPTSGLAGGSSALSATASSGLAVTFGSSTPATCTVAGSTVSYLAVGTCTVTADQAGDTVYNPAPQVTLDITVNKAEQAITGFAADPAAGVVDGSSALSATADSGLAVTFGSSTPAVCTVAGATVSYLTAGTCTVTADQAGDDNYNAAPQVTLDITVAKADQTITGFTATPTTGDVGDTSTLSATASSGLAVTFGSSTLAVCTVAGNTVSLIASGTCTVTADQAGDDNYNAAAQVTTEIGVAKTDQVITGFAADPASGVIGGTSALSATSDSGLAVTFGSSTLAICTVTGSTVDYLGAGTCTVTADQAGDDDYNPAPQVTLDITVAKNDQAITGFAANPAGGGVGDTSTLSATADSGLTVTFGSSTPAICTVSGDTVTFVAAGTCTATADQAGDDDYNPAPQVTLDITVAKADQTITGLAANPASGVAGGSSALSATADSGLAVTFGSSTPAICTVAGATVSYVAVGTCTVTADQAGDADYNAAPQVTLGITVAQGSQTITSFGTIPRSAYVGSTSTLVATASSGLVVTFGSNTPAVCTVSGDTVSYLIEGICTLTADQAGDANYTAAPQVLLDIDVALTPPKPIPTLSQWSLLIMFLMMLGFGGLVIRRKQSD